MDATCQLLDSETRVTFTNAVSCCAGSVTPTTDTLIANVR